MSTHQNVYTELRPLFPKVMQKAGEYLNLQINGVDESVKLCSHEGQYKTMPLRFRTPNLVNLIHPYILEVKLESNKYYKCSIKDWTGFLEFIKKHGKFSTMPQAPTKTKQKTVSQKAPPKKTVAKPKAQKKSDLPISEIIKHFCSIINCRDCMWINHILCDNQFHLPQPGYIGKNYAQKKVLLIAQNPGDCRPGHKLYAEAQKYAELIGELQTSPKKETLKNLNDFLAEFILRWPVFKKFPAQETGLNIHDIAYVNLIHCRTKDNRPIPKQACTNCIENYFLPTISLLAPELVISLGKHPHSYITQNLTERNIPHAFINRKQDLSSTERQKNRNEVIELIRSVHPQ